MRIMFAAAAFVLAVPSLALAQGLQLRHPADADRDGVVTEEEKADYAASKGFAGPELPVAAPKPGGGDTSVSIGPNTGPQIPGSVSGQVDPAPNASDFQAAMDAKDRADRAKDD